MIGIAWLLDPGPRYSYKKVILILLTSLFSIFFLYTISFLPFYLYRSEEGIITRMILKQGSDQKMTIPLFAEILSLSCDQPTSFHQFNPAKEEERLLTLGIFEHLKIKKRKPGLLLIDYKLKEATFIWGNLTNTLLNREGNAMPYAPYFSPKSIPILYVEAEKMREYFEYALFLQEKVTRGELIWIDLREIEASSKGRREAVLKLRQGKGEHLLRLDPMGDVEEQMVRYYALLKQMKRECNRVIDLRFPHVAYLQVL